MAAQTAQLIQNKNLDSVLYIYIYIYSLLLLFFFYFFINITGNNYRFFLAVPTKNN